MVNFWLGFIAAFLIMLMSAAVSVATIYAQSGRSRREIMAYCFAVLFGVLATCCFVYAH